MQKIQKTMIARKYLNGSFDSSINPNAKRKLTAKNIGAKTIAIKIAEIIVEIIESFMFKKVKG